MMLIRLCTHLGNSNCSCNSNKLAWPIVVWFKIIASFCIALTLCMLCLSMTCYANTTRNAASLCTSADATVSCVRCELIYAMCDLKWHFLRGAVFWAGLQVLWAVLSTRLTRNLHHHPVRLSVNLRPVPETYAPVSIFGSEAFGPNHPLHSYQVTSFVLSTYLLIRYMCSIAQIRCRNYLCKDTATPACL